MNIFDIEQEYLDLMSDIDNAEGEITTELAERLKINEEDREQKITNYCGLIKSIDGNTATIKAEIERLKKLIDSNDNKDRSDNDNAIE